MQYITLENQRDKTYIQYDKNGKLMVIYHFNPSKWIMDRITLVNKPDYFLLPSIDIGQKRKFGCDYPIDCSAFENCANAEIVVPEGSVRLVNNNHDNLSVVLAEDQMLYGVCDEQIGGMLPFDDPYGMLVITNNKEQTEEEKEYVREGGFEIIKRTVKRLPDGIKNAPEFDSEGRVNVDKSKVYDKHKKEIIKVEEIKSCESEF